MIQYLYFELITTILANKILKKTVFSGFSSNLVCFKYIRIQF